MSVGINSVREILVRVPAILREPDMGDFIEGTALCLYSIPHFTSITAIHLLHYLSIHASVEECPSPTRSVCPLLYR